MSKKTFFLKLFFILFPVVAILALPVYVLTVSGEFAQPDRVLDKQLGSDKNILYAGAYANFEEYYRLEGILKTKPDVIAIGNSRALDFRQQFFNPGVKF